MNKISCTQLNSSYCNFWFKWVESVVEIICNHDIMTSCVISIIFTHINTRDNVADNSNINNTRETYKSIINDNGINIEGLAVFLSFSTEDVLNKIFDILLSRVNKNNISINNTNNDDSNYKLLQILHLCYLSLLWKIKSYLTPPISNSISHFNISSNDYFHNSYSIKKLYNDNIDNVFNEKSLLCCMFIWLYNVIKSSQLGCTLPEIYGELIEIICIHSQQSNELNNNNNNSSNLIIYNKLNNIQIFLSDISIFNILSFQLVLFFNIGETNTDTSLLINFLLLQYYNRTINENNNLNINADKITIKKIILNIWKLLMKLCINLAEKYAILDPSNSNELDCFSNPIFKNCISSLLFAVLQYGGEFFNNLDGKDYILLINLLIY